MLFRILVLGILFVVTSSCMAQSSDPSPKGSSKPAADRNEAERPASSSMVNPTPTQRQRPASSDAVGAGEVERLKLEIVAIHPHDPTAFTQGLLWHDGELYESTGLWGRSTLKRYLPHTGDLVARHDLEPTYFGEGLALVGERLVQLTWKAGVAIVYDRDSLTPIDQWGYNGEGWGLAYDGEHLIMSDGTSRLTYRSTEDFRWLETVEVKMNDRPLAKLNELEFVDGRLYANVWGKDQIVRLDPATGIVDGSIHIGDLLTPMERRIADVLNGIAYDPETRTFWLTGKLWPRLFQARFVPVDS